MYFVHFSTIGCGGHYFDRKRDFEIMTMSLCCLICLHSLYFNDCECVLFMLVYKYFWNHTQKCEKAKIQYFFTVLLG